MALEVRRAKLPLMRYGVTLFATDTSIGIIELAKAVEERGLDSLWVPEHTHIPTSRRTPYPAAADGVLPDEYRQRFTRLVLPGSGIDEPLVAQGDAQTPAPLRPHLATRLVDGVTYVVGTYVSQLTATSPYLLTSVVRWSSNCWRAG